MKKSKSSNRGQVLVLFVLAIIGLVGIVGLAVDGGYLYSDRRQAQNAADTASLAAAVYSIGQQRLMNAGTVTYSDCTDVTTPSTCGAQVKQAAWDMANKNGYNNDVTDNKVQVYVPPIDGPYRTKGYIEVVISTNVHTWFARVLGIGVLHNRVNAVALAQYTPSYTPYAGGSLVQLGQGKGTCPSDFNVGGNGNIILNGGGIYVNSQNPTCAYKQTSCTTTLILQNGATIDAVGGADVGTCNSPPINKVTNIYPFPPAPLISQPPSECGTAGTFAPFGVKTTLYQPGNYYSYNSFPVNNDTAILTPGVYCINGQIQTNKDLSVQGGGGVFFYIRPTGSVTITGGSIVLKAMTTGNYAGFLIYQDWDLNSTVTNCKIVGNLTSSYTGMIFTPYCNMTIAGTSTSTGLGVQVIAYTMSLTGTNTLNFTYDASKLPVVPEVENTGLSH